MVKSTEKIEKNKGIEIKKSKTWYIELDPGKRAFKARTKPEKMRQKVKELTFPLNPPPRPPLRRTELVVTK